MEYKTPTEKSYNGTSKAYNFNSHIGSNSTAIGYDALANSPKPQGQFLWLYNQFCITSKQLTELNMQFGELLDKVGVHVAYPQEPKQDVVKELNTDSFINNFKRLNIELGRTANAIQTKLACLREQFT